MNCNGLAVFCRFWPEMAFRVEAADQHESHVVQKFRHVTKIRELRGCSYRVTIKIQTEKNEIQRGLK